jgi:predicted lipase
VSHFSVNALLYSSTSDLHGFTGAFVDEAKKHVSLAVVFRGSYSIQNWVDDLTVKQVAYRPDKAPNMLIHEGFLNAYMSVDPQAQSSIQSMIEKYSSSYSLDLTCIGHSLGAACAQVACLQLMSQKAIADAIQPQNVFLYNYGQPRVGNAAFAQWAESQFGAYYRLTHWRDLVPHVPLELATENGYKHGGVEVWYTEDFSNHTVCTVGEDGKCSDSIADVSIPDHLDYLNTPLSGMSYCGPA